MKSLSWLGVTLVLSMATTATAFAENSNKAENPNEAVQVKTAQGTVAGATDSDGVRSFKGVPYAKPPVGELRWKPPQPPESWQGVRQADKFGPRAMQRPIYGDMVFRSDGVSEDCLYLNVWTPAKSADERLPVLVYFYGGGFQAGDGSEPRYDGQSMARRGIVAVTVNYRLGVFGFLAHPELTAESPEHASGNYGLLDQNAALRWVQQNIAAFGGDPGRVTIGGESAGSISVSAQMASPLSKGLIAGAIGESGSLVGAFSPVPLSEAEQTGVRFANKVKANSIAELRTMPADKLLEATADRGVGRFPLTIDGYFLPKPPVEIFTAGEQARVPLLVGWNSAESSDRSVLGSGEPTRENYAQAVKKLYGDRADKVLELYPANTAAEVIQAATDLASDRFMGYSTWKWSDLHGKTGGHPVYRYFYAHPRPGADWPGAVHSAEIEYALGNLDSNIVYTWTPEDRKVSEIMQTYFANFIRTGDPNGDSLPDWPPANRGDEVQFLHIEVEPRVESSDAIQNRYRFLDQQKSARE